MEEINMAAFEIQVRTTDVSNEVKNGKKKK